MNNLLEIKGGGGGGGGGGFQNTPQALLFQKSLKNTPSCTTSTTHPP